MKDLIPLFKLMEISRSMPQYGYLTSGINKSEVSNLAEHHYLVTFFAWQIARNAKRRGAKLDVEKVMEYAMLHDVGELFGGDISMPYAKRNPKARKAAKAFEAENQKFISKLFGKDKNYVKKLMNEVLDAKTDEALVAKLADYVEVSAYLCYVGQLIPDGYKLHQEKLKGIADRIKDPVLKEVASELLAIPAKEFLGNGVMDIWFK